MSTIAALGSAPASLSSSTRTGASGSGGAETGTTGSVDTRDTVTLSAEAQALLDKGGDTGPVGFVDSVQKITSASQQLRARTLDAAEAVRAEAQAAGEAQGQAMNERTGDQSVRARTAPGGRSRTLVRR